MVSARRTASALFALSLTANLVLPSEAQGAGYYFRRCGDNLNADLIMQDGVIAITTSSGHALQGRFDGTNVWLIDDTGDHCMGRHDGRAGFTGTCYTALGAGCNFELRPLDPLLIFKQGTGAGTVGSTCKASACEAGLYCDESKLYEGGYCSAECPQGRCPLGGTCVAIRGKAFCFRRCDGKVLCDRKDVSCVHVGHGVKACIPPPLIEAMAPGTGSGHVEDRSGWGDECTRDSNCNPGGACQQVGDRCIPLKRCQMGFCVPYRE